MVDRCAAAVGGLGLHAHPLLEVMFAGPDSELARLLDDTLYAQPALYALQCGLWALWRSWGLAAEAVLGHSVGEYAAAYGGAMAAVFAPAERVAAAIARVNAEASGPGVSLAAENGTHRVVSGPAGLVTALLEQFSADGMRCQKLAISHAFHSALLDPMLEGLEAAAAAVTQRAPELALVSNLTGEVFAAGAGIAGAGELAGGVGGAGGGGDFAAGGGGQACAGGGAGRGLRGKGGGGLRRLRRGARREADSAAVLSVRAGAALGGSAEAAARGGGGASAAG